MKLLSRIAVCACLAFVLLIARGYWNATRDPVIRTASIRIADWPKGIAPINVQLLSDVHVAGPDMPPTRANAIVEKLNRLKPDLILVAGDLVSEKRLATHIYAAPEVIASLRGLRAPLGVVIAMGNHDHWFDEKGFREGIPKAGFTLLINQAIKRGPIVIGGVDDDFSGHADIASTYAAMGRLKGPRIILTHSPDIIPALPYPVAAVFAGHTHCGQIVLPWGEPVSSVTRYGRRFDCGLKSDKGQLVIIGAGLGTSVLPLRYNAPPDVWLVTLGS